jgi:hypothetical protein
MLRANNTPDSVKTARNRLSQPNSSGVSRMKRHIVLAAAFSVLLGSASTALANGAISEFPAGGVVVFKPETNISIDREELEIGLDLISVRYVFRTFGSEPLERTVGFPMARVSLEDGPDNIENTSKAEKGDDPRNYMAFKVVVNGEPLTPKLHEYAWSGDTNVTGKLLDLGVPLFAWDHAELAQLPEATIGELRRQGLMPEDESRDWLGPQWEYQAVYEWTQTFEPGETIVEISYKPLFGGGYVHDYYEGGALVDAYCLGTQIRQTLARIREERGYTEPLRVAYILETATNWNGPIRDFRLKISSDESLFSFCVPDGLFAVGDGVSWVAKDFVPTSDLDIVFYFYDPMQ